MCILCIVIIGFDASGSISSGQSFGRWLSFLTSWTWVLCLFVLFPALSISLYYIKTEPPATASCNAWMRLHWIMWEMAGWTPPPLPFHLHAHLFSFSLVVLSIPLALHSLSFVDNYHSLLGAGVSVGQHREIFSKTHAAKVWIATHHSSLLFLTLLSYFLPLFSFIHSPLFCPLSHASSSSRHSSLPCLPFIFSHFIHPNQSPLHPFRVCSCLLSRSRIIAECRSPRFERLGMLFLRPSRRMCHVDNTSF